jgi:hypothetical protein
MPVAGGSVMSLSEPVATAANGTGFAQSRRSTRGRWTLTTLAFVLSLASENCSSTSGSKGTVVSLAALSSSVPACGSGYAHPNVCCQSGTDQAIPVVCTELPGAPFLPCDPDVALTYPDPRTCCPLNGEGSCVDVDADAGAVIDPTTSASCASPCPVGSAPPTGSDSLPSCGNNPRGGECECCGDPGRLCVGYNVFSCTNAVVGGPPPACVGSNVPTCGQCPTGWQTPAGMSDLCCRTIGTGATQCFSQSGNTGI